jgi:hypothetical protein
MPPLTLRAADPMLPPTPSLGGAPHKWRTSAANLCNRYTAMHALNPLPTAKQFVHPHAHNAGRPHQNICAPLAMAQHVFLQFYC